MEERGCGSAGGSGGGVLLRRKLLWDDVGRICVVEAVPIFLLASRTN